jgi:thiol:disulfide interchange protein DsbD
MKAFKFSGGEKLPVYEGHSKVFVTGKVAKNAAIGKRTIVATFSYQACDENTCFPPAEATATIPTEVVSAGVPVSNAHEDIFGSGAKATTVPVNASSTSDPASFFGRGTLVGLLLVFGMGVLLSFTPCVYPMKPVTIGYFGTQTERSTWRLALLAGLYVLGLAAMYSTLGAIAALTGGMFGAALQNPYVPLLIGGVLIALALSMFGVYEFKVPSFVMAKSQGRQGPVGALFMGLLFGVVCAPCVGPFTVALLLYIAKLGKPFFGFLTFFVLSLGLGMPFFFLAFFSSAINRLPQAGMWMVSVRNEINLNK